MQSKLNTKKKTNYADDNVKVSNDMDNKQKNTYLKIDCYLYGIDWLYDGHIMLFQNKSN